MKSLVFALTLIAGFAAHADTLHTCTYTSQGTGRLSTAAKTSGTFYVVNAAGNVLRVSDNTVLDFRLPMAGMNADVYVNNQPEFMFSGNMASGTFESAWDKGTIACDQGQEVGAYYSRSDVNTPALKGSILGSCFVGSSATVVADLVRFEGVKASQASIDSSTGDVSFTRVETQCLKGHGTNPDDFVCLKSGLAKVTYTVPNCQRNFDPR